MTKYVSFHPYVVFGDDGTLEIDWSDTYNWTLDEGGDIIDDDYGLINRFDEILGWATDHSPSERLRRLADYWDHYYGVKEPIPDMQD